MADTEGNKSRAESVRVVVRCRPHNRLESRADLRTVVQCDGGAKQIVVTDLKAANTSAQNTFTFDAVFGCGSTQSEVYTGAVQNIVDGVLQGYNGTIFAYGQTGAGKTFTMEGSSDEPGIMPRSFQQIFAHVAEHSGKQQFLVRVSFLEVYNEEVRDLLSKQSRKPLDVREHSSAGVYIKGLTAIVVKSASEMERVLEVGKKNRATGATLMNQESSRSHSILSITVEMADGVANGGSGHIRVGRLNLVDLAGSERQSKTHAAGDRLREATKINLSLTALGNVIKALVEHRTGHVPYRDSKLTRLLQDSLGGNTKTAMIANIAPGEDSFEETCSTLRYACRAKNIRNQPRINEDPKDALLRKFQDQIKQLQADLAAARASQVQPEPAADSAEQHEAPDSQHANGGTLHAAILEQIRAEAEKQTLLNLSASQQESRCLAQHSEQLAQSVRAQQASLQALQDQHTEHSAQREELQERLAMLEQKLQANSTKADAKSTKADAALHDETMWQTLAERRAQKASLQEEVEAVTKQVQIILSTPRNRRTTAEDGEGRWPSQSQASNVSSSPAAVAPLQEQDSDRPQWDDIAEEVVFLSQPTSAESSSAFRRPTSAWAKEAAKATGAPRFLADNILQLEMEHPIRTTCDIGDPQAQEFLDASFGRLDAALLE